MVCMAALTTLSTTVGTGIIAGGAITYMLTAQQAEAEVVKIANQEALMSSSTASVGNGVIINGNTAMLTGGGAITNITSDAMLSAMAGGTGYITITAWVKTPKPNAQQCYFGIGGQNDGIKFAQYQNYMQVTTKGVSDENFTGMGLTNNTWTLVAFSINLSESGTSKCYRINEGDTVAESRDFTPTWNDLTNEFFAIGSANGHNDRDLYVGMISDIKVYYSDALVTKDEISGLTGNTYPDVVLTWNTEGESNNWSTGAWVEDGESSAWSTFSNAVFAGVGETVVVDGNVLADTISVTGAGWTLTDASEDADGSLVAYGLVVGDGSTATDLTVDVGISALSVVVKKEATLKLTDDQAHVQFTNGNLCEGTLYIENGASVTVSGCSGGNAYIRGDVNIKADGTLILNATDSLGWNSGSVPANINLEGKAAEGDAAAVNANLSVTGKQTLVSNINMSGNAYVYGGQLEFFGGDFNISGVDNVIESEMLARKDTTITVADSSSLVIKGNTSNGDPGQAENYRITKEGAGELIIGGTLNHSGGTEVNAGSLIVSDGGSLGTQAVTVANNATLKITGTGSYGSGNVTYAAGSNLIYDVAGSGLTLATDTTFNNLTLSKGNINLGANLTVNGTLTMGQDTALSVNAGNTITLSAVEGNIITGLTVNNLNAVGTYTVLAGSVDDVTISNLFLSVDNGFEATYADGVVTVVAAEVAQVGSLVWVKDGADEVWMNSSSKNWMNGETSQRWTDTSDATFSGEGENVTVPGIVTPNSIVVSGTGWEWSGSGDIDCATTLTVGDGAAASDLTISTSGDKAFTGGVQITEGATLVVKNISNWTGTVTGAGTLEFATGTTLTTSSGIINTIIPSTDNDANIPGVIGTVKLTNNTVLSHDSGNDSNWKWVPSVVKFDVTDGSRLNIDVNFDYNTWDASGDQIVRIAGAGDGSEGAAGSAVSFVRNKHFLGALELADDATVYVEAGAQGGFTSHTGDGHLLTKTGEGVLCFSSDVTGDITVNGGSIDLFSQGNQTLNGTITLNGGKLIATNGNWDNRIKTIQKLTGTGEIIGNSWNVIWQVEELAGEGDIAWMSDGTHWAPCVLNINGGQYTGTLTADRLAGKASNRGAYQSVLQINSGAQDTFSGAVVNLNGQAGDAWVQLALNADKVAIGGLDGTQYTHIFAGAAAIEGGEGANLCMEKSASTGNALLVISGDGEHTYAGSVGAGISIERSGAGIQNFTGDMTAFDGDIAVKSGILNMTTGLSSVGRSINLSAGSTLGAALTLNGGSLTLDATGTAASLGDNTLALGEVKTDLTLSLLDTANSGTPITLLSGIATGLELVEGATLGSYFNLVDYSIISSTGIQLLGEGADLRTDITAERLLASSLSIDGDKLVLRLLPAELVNDPLYWETADGNGDWSGLSWSAQNADAPKPPAVDPGKMGIDFSAAEVATYEGEVIFNGDADATVQVDVTAKVKEMTVENGKYTFANDGGSLTVTDTLTIGENGSAALNVKTKVEDIELAGATSSLSTSAGLEVSGKLTATDGGTITNTGTEAVTLTGAELGSVSLLGSGGYVLKNATFSGQVTNTDSTITLSGKHTVDREALADAGLIQSSVDMYTDLNDSVSADGNGYKSGSFTTQLFTVEKNVSGEDIAQSAWQLNDANNTGLSVTVNDDDDGSYTFVTESESTEYYVNKDLSYDAKDFKDAKASKLVIETAHVVISLQTALHSTEKGYIHALEQGTVALKGDNVILNQSSLDAAEGATITINGSKDDTYVIDDGSISLHKNVKAFSENASWSGTVKTGAISGGLTPVNISALGNANSTVEADSISGVALTIGNVGKVNVLGDVSLTNGDSTVNDMTVEGNLSLGATEDSSMTADTLTVDGEDGIKLQNGSTVDADTLTVTNGGIDLSEGSAVTADEALTVGAGITMGKDAQVKAGELKVGSLSLEEGSTVTVTGDLTVGEGGISFGELSDTAAVTAKSLTNTELNVTLDEEKMRLLADSKDDKTQPIATLMEVTEGSAASIDLNGYGTDTINLPGLKYGYTLTWNDTLLQLGAVANENYMKEKFEGAEPNAIAGATLMDEAFASDGIGAGGDLEKLLASVDNGSMTEEGMAAVAGASTASLGMAFAGDVERQLRAIRNRTTTMGVNQCVVNEGMPYFNAWVNAEGNFGELDQDGLASGYQLDSWGGTVGFDVDVNPNLTLGLAVTAMYGDLTVDGPDMLEGDLDTYYVTAFARYSKRAWTHTFIGTIGKMDGSYERTVNYAGGSYKTEGDTDGMAFGLMYEVGRVYALTEDGDACLQPVFNIAYRHTTVGGYTEDGGDAALDVDDQTLDTITLGAGARMQAVVGENLYNRTSVLELRALAKLDVGDRASEADVAFIGGGSRATVESAELGAFGVELGAGLSIPVGDENDGTIFFDVSAELRSGYSNVNGTVGYRINF